MDTIGLDWPDNEADNTIGPDNVNEQDNTIGLDNVNEQDHSIR